MGFANTGNTFAYLPSKLQRVLISFDELLDTLRITSSSITKLSFASQKLWVGTGDGSALGLGLNWTTNPNLEKAKVEVVLTGSDCEPIFGMAAIGRADGSVVATGARDGFVRTYWVPATE